MKQSHTQNTLLLKILKQDRVKLQIINSKTCPVNLLGRDVMIGLGVGVSPTTHGFKPIRVNETVGEGAVEE